jgi:hypothetical protein
LWSKIAPDRDAPKSPKKPDNWEDMKYSERFGKLSAVYIPTLAYLPLKSKKPLDIPTIDASLPPRGPASAPWQYVYLRQPACRRLIRHVDAAPN